MRMFWSSTETRLFELHFLLAERSLPSVFFLFFFGESESKREIPTCHGIILGTCASWIYEACALKKLLTKEVYAGT